MTDHIVLPATHTFMMNNLLVIAKTVNFLREGKFDHQLTLRERSAAPSEIEVGTPGCPLAYKRSSPEIVNSA